MTTTQLAMKDFFQREDVVQKFQELLGKRASSYLTSVLSVVSQSELLAKADPKTVYMAALTSATLDLPINQNLGFAYIVPYKGQAQFQMGYKGFIQLALRSGQFLTISATPVYEGQLVEENPLTGYVFDRKAKKSEVVIGYASYFKLLNWFEKTFYMTKAEIERHANLYSAQFKKSQSGLWKDKFDEMATKTVIKLLLSKFAPLSVEMQKAVIADQGVLQDENFDQVDYPDNDQWVIAEADLEGKIIDMTATNEVNKNTATDKQPEAEKTDTKQELF